jgi:hypothetical protein
MGTQGIFPPKAMGGLGWHEQGGWSHLSLYGTTFCRLFPLSANNAFDNHLLPNHLLLDGATKDLGRDYAERLLRTRAYRGSTTPWQAACTPLQTCLARGRTSRPSCALRPSPCAPAPWSSPL